MKISQHVFKDMVAMFKARRPGLDEVEAVYFLEGSGGNNQLTREIAQRVIRYLKRAGGYKSLGVANTLDVSMADGSGRGNVTRVTVEGDAQLRAALDTGGKKWDVPATTVMRKERLNTTVVADYRLA